MSGERPWWLQLEVGETLMRVASEEDLERSFRGGDCGIQGRTTLNLGLTDPAEDAHELEQEERDPCEEENRSWVGAYERAWRMSRAARPGGAGGGSTHP